MKEKKLTTSVVNEFLLFVSMKESEECLAAVKEMSANFLAKPKTTILYEPNRSLMDAVQSAAGIGKILTDFSEPSRERDVASKRHQTTESAPLSIPTHGPELAKMMYVGARVMRGKNWKWGNEDKPEGKGSVMVVTREQGWMTVRWDNGRQDGYRMGAENAFDLMLVPGMFKPPSGS